MADHGDDRRENGQYRGNGRDREDRSGNGEDRSENSRDRGSRREVGEDNCETGKAGDREAGDREAGKAGGREEDQVSNDRVVCDEREEEVGNGKGNQICEMHEKNGNDCVMHELHGNDHDHDENVVNLDINCGVNLVNDNHDGNILVMEEDMAVEEVAEAEEVVHAAKVFDKIPAAKVFDNTSVTGAEVADTRGLSMNIAEVWENEGRRGTRRTHGNGKFGDVDGHEVHGVCNMHGMQKDSVHGHEHPDRGKAYFDAICRGTIDDYNRWVLALEKVDMVGEFVVEEEIVPASQVIIRVHDKEIEAVVAGVEVGASGSGTRNAGINAGIGASNKVS